MPEAGGYATTPSMAVADCSFAIFSGGTACNKLVPYLHKHTDKVAHILPVTDNGGSTAKIMQVVGGPAIGDIRSRLSRLSRVAAEKNLRPKVSGFTGESEAANGSYSKCGEFEGCTCFAKSSRRMFIFSSGSTGAWYISPERGSVQKALAVAHCPRASFERANSVANALGVDAPNRASNRPPEGAWKLIESNATGDPTVDFPDLALVRLLDTRLTGESSESAEAEFNRLVNGTHCLWKGVGDATKSALRTFLGAFGNQVAMRSGHSDIVLAVDPEDEQQFAKLNSTFDYSKASVGNCIFTGMRLLFGSLPTAIMMWCRLAQLPEDTQVLPCINTNVTLTIGAELEDDTTIIGQNAISHPKIPGMDTKHAEKQPMSSRIRNIFYVNAHGGPMKEPFPPYGNTIRAVADADVIIYSMGSLYTSIIPSLIVPGMGKAVKSARRKILLLNACNDRETTWYENGKNEAPSGYTMLDFAKAITKALFGDDVPISDAVTDIICIESSQESRPIKETHDGKTLEETHPYIKMHQVTNERGFMNLEEVADTIMYLGCDH